MQTGCDKCPAGKFAQYLDMECKTCRTDDDDVYAPEPVSYAYLKHTISLSEAYLKHI